MEIANLINCFLELLYPKRCPGCDVLLNRKDYSKGFCPKCRKGIKLIGDNACMKCGAPLRKETDEFCPDCRKMNHKFIQGKAVFRYSGPMKNAMYRFKYSNRRCYGKTFSDYALKQYGSWLKKKGIEVIIPVPMYEKKKRKRGYNQAEVFAKALSELTGIPVQNEIVRRVRDTSPMKQLNYLERKKNLEKAFKLSESSVKFKKVLIVDDIYTTGTTIDVLAEELRLGGASEVYFMSVCIGEVS